MQSLYDSLHLPNPNAPEAPVQPWPDKMTAQEFAERVVNSSEFRMYILLGVGSGNIPQGVVKQLMDYAWGQPTKRVEFEDKTPYAHLSKTQISHRLAQLQQIVQELPDEAPAVAVSESPSVH